MPQMAPMNWTLMFTFFTLLYIFSMLIIYFSSMCATNNKKYISSTKNNMINMIWKW